MTPEEMAELYKSGKTLEQVADIAGCCSTTVRYYLKKLGVPRRPCAQAPGYSRLSLDMSIEEMVARYKQGETAAEIAQAAGCGSTSILTRLRRQGIRSYRVKSSAQRDAVMLEMRANGCSLNDIAFVLNTSSGCVYNRLRRLGA